jgi:hypothetical protein
MCTRPKTKWQLLGKIGIFMVLALPGLYATPQPSHNRNWVPAQQVLPNAIINGDIVTIKNVRNNRYSSVTDVTPQYEDRTYDLSQYQSNIL